MDILIKMSNTRTKLRSTVFFSHLWHYMVAGDSLREILLWTKAFYQNQPFFGIQSSFSPNYIKWCLQVSYMYEKLFRVSHPQKNTRNFVFAKVKTWTLIWHCLIFCDIDSQKESIQTFIQIEDNRKHMKDKFLAGDAVLGRTRAHSCHSMNCCPKISDVSVVELKNQN